MIVELIYDLDCPSVQRTREQLLKAFTDAGLPPRWTEWDRASSESPRRVRGYGSPTILVDGRDLIGKEPTDCGPSCRLYGIEAGTATGVPSARLIAGALREATNAPQTGGRSGVVSGWRSSLGAVPGIAFAFLPKLLCPACFPAYAGLLSALGLGFLLKQTYLLPLTVVFLAIAVGALAYRAGARRGYGPFVVGLIASAVVMIGKFALNSDATMYAGIALLVGGSVWNAWPRKTKTRNGCRTCVPPSAASEGSTVTNRHQGGEVRT